VFRRRLPETSRARLKCSSESPLYVSKQFTLEQLARDGSAVDSNEGALAALAVPMDCSSDEFFSGPGFALYEHRNLSTGGKPDLLLDLALPGLNPIRSSPDGGELLPRVISGFFRASARTRCRSDRPMGFVR